MSLIYQKWEDDSSEYYQLAELQGALTVNKGRIGIRQVSNAKVVLSWVILAVVAGGMVWFWMEAIR